MKWHVGYLPELDLPIKVVETIGLKHDGQISEQLVDKCSILIEDRTYFKMKRIGQFAENGQVFVFWIKENVRIFQCQSLKRFEREDSSVTRDLTCKLGTSQSWSMRRHRVVMFHDEKERKIYVVTNSCSVSVKKIADMDKIRWTIETFFLWIKQHSNVPVLFGTT